MTDRRVLPNQTAALAGIPGGIQSTGPWIGRRQLAIRFAVEAETATMYRADALRAELERLSARSRYHSILIAGRDPVLEFEYLSTALRGGPSLPVMLDHDGQRHEYLDGLLADLALMQVTLDGLEREPAIERVAASLQLAASRGVAHAIAVVPADGASDARLLQIVEQTHAASPATQVVVHPSATSAAEPDRRWIVWLERAVALHEDVRLLPRLPAPTGMR